MSAKWMFKSFELQVGNAGRKLVLLKLADNANDAGECWPSYQHIADQCEMGRSTVKAHIKELAKAGFIRVEARNDGKSSNHYVLTFDENSVPLTRSESNPAKNKPGQNNKDTRSESGSTRSESDPLTRSESDPRTYHSSEPLNEPVSEAAREPEHPVFQQHEDDNQRMALSWQYREKPFAERCLSMGVNLNTVNRTLITDALQSFRNYHEPKGRMNSQSVWESQFAMWLKKDIQRSKNAMPAAANGYSAPSAPPAWRDFDFDQI